VLPEWSPENQCIVAQLKPEFLFCDKTLLPESDKDIWRGGWQWAVYNLDDIPSAIEMANRGIPWLETNEIGTLIDSAELNGRT
jgi:glycerophosphoryl diester phosphodiesterase